MTKTSPVFSNFIINYLDSLYKKAKDPDSSPELSYRPVFDAFLNGLSEGMQLNGISLSPLAVLARANAPNLR